MMRKINKRRLYAFLSVGFAIVALSGLLGGIIVGSASAKSVDRGACTCAAGQSMIAGRCVERAR